MEKKRVKWYIHPKNFRAKTFLCPYEYKKDLVPHYVLPGYQVGGQINAE